jgi:hypothetical protein
MTKKIPYLLSNKPYKPNHSNTHNLKKIPVLFLPKYQPTSNIKTNETISTQ